MKYKIMVAAIIILLVIISCKPENKVNAREEGFSLTDAMTENIELAEVKQMPVVTELKLFGKIIPDENQLAEIFPLVGGNVCDVNAELGDYVEKDKVLAIIKSGEIADYERQLIDAQSDVLMADKNLATAQDLFESKLNSEKDVMSARKELEKAKAELNRINEIFKIYGIDNQSNYYIKSPISGFIVEKKITRDMQLRSDRQDNIFTIAQTSEVWAMANVNESDIAKITAGCQAEVRTISYPDIIFKGKVDRVFNILDPQTKAMKVRIKLQNKDYLLKPEMNAIVLIKINEDINLLCIPSKAVIFEKGKNYVIVHKNKDDVAIRELSIYKEVNELAYVNSGLTVGESIITEGNLLIYDALKK